MLQQQLPLFQKARMHSQPHPKGSAPYMSSSMYKVQKPRLKPSAKTLDHRFNLESRRPLQQGSKVNMQCL
ncbi:hypothetical protein F4815DRAFT_462519 [Daldinia loculata]|nr:hypothetical protein F4815DRAFT_462519 [Daldinia loculata]